jgi:hypothetical protein
MKTLASLMIPLLHILLVAAAMTPPLQAQPPAFDWATLLTGLTQVHEPLDTASDPQGNVIVAYRIWDSIATSVATSTTWSDNVLAKLDSSGNVLWSLAVLPNIRKVATDTSGDIYVAGSLLRGHPLTRPLLPDDYFAAREIPTEGTGTAYLAKISSAGVLEWVRRVGGSAVVDANAVALDAEGNYFAAGFYTGGPAQFGSTSLPVPTTTNARNVFIAKYAPGGKVQWVTVGETSWDGTGQGGLAVDRSGSVLLAWSSSEPLSFAGVGQELAGLSLVKFDRLGRLLWARNVEPPFAYGGRQLAIDHDGNSFVAYSYDRGEMSPMILKKYGPNGDLLWSRQPQVNSESASYVTIAVDSEGNCLAGGYFSISSPPPDYPFLHGEISFDNKTITTSARFDAFVVKYTGSGEVRWAIQTVGLDPLQKGFPQRVSDVRMSAIALAPGGGFFFSGSIKGSVGFGTAILEGPASEFGDSQIFATYIVDREVVRPEICLRREGNRLRLSWPASFSGFMLESTESLLAPQWISAAAPVVEGDQNVVTVETADNAYFFRLRTP